MAGKPRFFVFLYTADSGVLGEKTVLSGKSILSGKTLIQTRKLPVSFRVCISSFRDNTVVLRDDIQDNDKNRMKY